MSVQRRREAPESQDLSNRQLVSAVENELIPRLLTTLRDESVPLHSPSHRQCPDAGDWADADGIRQFAAVSIDADVDALHEQVSTLVCRGVRLDAIYLHLVAPAARLLGQRWDDDEICFIDVHLGLGRLHRLLRDCMPIGFRHTRATPLSVLLSSAPGDQHTFAIAVVTEFFRRFGWQADNMSGLAGDSVVKQLASAHYDAIGFSLNSRACVGALKSLIPRLRHRSINADLVIMIGGDMLAKEPELIASLEVDLIATDAHDAVLEAERLVDDVRARRELTREPIGAALRKATGT